MVFQEYPITLAANNIVLFCAIAIYPWSDRSEGFTPHENAIPHSAKVKHLIN